MGVTHMNESCHTAGLRSESSRRIRQRFYSHRKHPPENLALNVLIEIHEPHSRVHTRTEGGGVREKEREREAHTINNANKWLWIF